MTNYNCNCNVSHKSLGNHDDHVALFLATIIRHIRAVDNSYGTFMQKMLFKPSIQPRSESQRSDATSNILRNYILPILYHQCVSRLIGALLSIIIEYLSHILHQGASETLVISPHWLPKLYMPLAKKLGLLAKPVKSILLLGSISVAACQERTRSRLVIPQWRLRSGQKWHWWCLLGVSR